MHLLLDLDTSEGRGASRTLDGEGVGAPVAEDSAGVLEELDALRASVGEGGLDREVIDVDHSRRPGDGELERGRGSNARGESSNNGSGSRAHF